MSAIFTPEVASLVGCLDDAGFADGSAVSTHLLRSLARSANRLKTKEQPLFNLVWPTTNYTDVGAYMCSGIAPTRWTRVMSPIPVKKRPGLRAATCWLKANIANGIRMDVYIASRPRPWLDGVAPTSTITGTGGFTNYLLADIPISTGDSDELELWLRATELGSLMNTGTYGAPADSTALGNVVSVDYNRAAIAVTGATWNTSATGAANSPAFGGHVVVFYDDNGTPITAPRDIVANGSTRLEFDPPLSSSEARLVSSTQEFKIFGGTAFALCNFGAVAIENLDQRLIAPYAYHPGAAVTGECLGQVLESSLEHFETQSQVVGYQPYQVINLIANPGGTSAIVSTASTWIDVGYFLDVHLPAIARRVCGAMYYKRANTSPAIVHLRVVVTDGVGTDTGTQSLDPPNGTFDPPAAVGVDHAVHTQWAQGDPSCGVISATVDLSAAKVSSGTAARTITVQGFSDGAGVGQPFQPCLIIAWWEP